MLSNVGELKMSQTDYKIRLSTKYKQAIEEPTKAKRAKEILGYLNLLVDEAKKMRKDKDLSQEQ